MGSKIKTFKVPIIGGQYKGKRIEIPSLDVTRSTKAIMRESLFNTIAFEVVDSNFVELFAGSGSVGLEALSRGAKKAYFIEADPQVFKILQKNIKNIDSFNAIAFNSDAFKLFDTLYNQLKKEGTPTIFYFDPPFSIREGMEDIYHKCLDLIAKAQDNFVQKIIIEHMSEIELPEEINNLEKVKRRKFGKSSLTYYEIKGDIE